MTCPCQDCHERRLVCHDHCEAYLAYHEARVAAREKAQRERVAADFLIENMRRRAKIAKARKP